MSDIKQRKLALEEAEKVETAFRALTDLSFFNCTSDGVDYWLNVCGKLGQMLCAGTTDGKPYVEPERWRVPTDEDAKRRPECRVRDSHGEEWKVGMVLYLRQPEVTAYPFYIVDNRNNVVPYRYCEILDNETKTE